MPQGKRTHTGHAIKEAVRIERESLCIFLIHNQAMIIIDFNPPFFFVLLLMEATSDLTQNMPLSIYSKPNSIFSEFHNFNKFSIILLSTIDSVKYELQGSYSCSV